MAQALLTDRFRGQGGPPDLASTVALTAVTTVYEPREPGPVPDPPALPEEPASEAYSHGRVDAFTREAYTPPSYSPDPYQAPPSYRPDPYAAPVAPMQPDFVPTDGGAVAATAQIPNQ